MPSTYMSNIILLKLLNHKWCKTLQFYGGIKMLHLNAFQIFNGLIVKFARKDDPYAKCHGTLRNSIIIKREYAASL